MSAVEEEDSLIRGPREAGEGLISLENATIVWLGVGGEEGAPLARTRWSQAAQTARPPEGQAGSSGSNAGKVRHAGKAQQVVRQVHA